MPSRRRLVPIAAAAMLGLALFAAPAAAATKSFSMVVLPASVPAGQSASFSVTLTNRTSPQQLGSADITVPAAFTAVSVGDPAGPATATATGNVVRLRNANLPPGGSIVVNVTAAVPSACGATYPWSVVAKQANDFNGPPGNDLTLDPATSSLTTNVAGGCTLRFVSARQPAAARVNQTISAIAYQPSGPSVQVEVVDGAGNRVTTSTASITLALGPSTGTGTLHGTVTASASAGVASFADLSIDAPGAYTLRATSAGLTAATSDPFRVDQVAVACIEDVTCSASLANATTTFDVTAPGNAATDAGFLVLDNGVGVAIDCAGYTELTATPTVIEGPDRAKTVKSTIDKRVMNAQPNNGASFLQMCFGAPYQFATRPGTPLTGVDTDGNGTTDFFYGLLPDCGAPPCVSSRNKTNAGDGVITTQAPGGTQDPAYRP
ncbi:MAG: hypothetical protein V7607_6659 [Solirubrobacteraceae bacterium]